VVRRRVPAALLPVRLMRWRQPAADVDVLHQTLAGRHEAACGFGGDWPVRSSCLSEYGSTIDQLAGHEPKVAGVRASDTF